MAAIKSEKDFLLLVSTSVKLVYLLRNAKKKNKKSRFRVHAEFSKIIE